MQTLFHRLKLPAFPERAFFYFLTIVFAGVFVQAAVSDPAVRQPLRLLSLAILLIIHIFIHWQIVWLEEKPRWIVPYVVGQGLLALIICLISGAYAMIFALYLALFGQVVGLFSKNWRRLAAAIGYILLLSGLSYALIYGLEDLPLWALAVCPMALFVYIYVTLYNRQTQARQEAQALLAQLEAANQQLSDYAARVEDLTIAAERQRMARELHDTLSQGLAGLILQLEAVDAHLANGRAERAQSIIKQAMLQARSTLAESRRAIDNLRAANNQKDGEWLEEAVRQEVERFRAAAGIPCTVEIDLPGDLPELALEAAQRVIQEGLSNTARHAHATQTSLRLGIEEENLLVEVKDNGRGFDPQAAEVQSGHYGLLGMHERARLAGGALQVESAPGQGCQIRLRLPLRPGQHALNAKG